VNSFCLFCPDAYDNNPDIALKIFVDRDEEKVIREFSNALNKMFNYIIDNLNRQPYPILDPDIQKIHDSGTDCEFCGGPFTPANPKCRHHNLIQENMRDQHAEDAILPGITEISSYA
jgi:hypothetical protein